MALLLLASLPATSGSAGAEARAGTTAVTGAGASAHHIDVTESSRVVVAHVRLAGSARVTAVRMSLVDGPYDGSGGHTRAYPRSYNDQSATRTRGTGRDGRWELRVRVPRYALPADYHLDVRATLASGREVLLATAPVLRVTDAGPDTVEPMLARMTRPGIDQQVSREGRLKVRVQVSDARSGVDQVMVCWGPLSGEITGFCGNLTRIRGTRHDGVWGAGLAMKGMPPGAAELDVSVWDRGGLESSWVGPSHAGTPYVDLVPGGRGGFEVVE